MEKFLKLLDITNKIVYGEPHTAYKAKIKILLKASIADPQGQAIAQALTKLGYNEIHDLRLGRYVEMFIDTNKIGEAKRQVNSCCQELLVNSIIESYTYELEAITKS